MKTKLVAVSVLVVVMSLIALAAAPQNILGITVQRPSGSGTGVQIVSVAPGSPCSSVLPPGDIIAYLNPNGGLSGNRNQDLAFEVTNLTDFQSLVSKIRPGATATFLILSGTSAMAPAKKVACRIPGNAAVPTSAPAPAPAPALTGAALLGVKAQSQGATSSGVKITAVAPGNPCQPALKVGDVIMQMNPNGGTSGIREVRGMNEFNNLVSQIKPGSTATLKVFPAGGMFAAGPTGRTVTCTFPATGAPGTPEAVDNAPAAYAPNAASGLTGKALLGVTVSGQSGMGAGVKITAIAPGNPCSPALNTGDVIAYLNPNGNLSGNRAQDVPYSVRGMAEFQNLASQIKPGATATIKIFPGGSNFSMLRTVTCTFPATAAPAPNP